MNIRGHQDRIEELSQKISRLESKIKNSTKPGNLTTTVSKSNRRLLLALVGVRP